MKNKKTLLDAMANIDDSFIEEAAHPEMILKAHRRAKRMRMLSSRRIGTLAACFVVAIGLVFAVPYLSQEDAMTEESSDDMNEALSQAVADQQAALEAQKAEQESFMAELDAANKAAEDAKAAAEKAAKEAADKVAKAAEKAAKEAKEAAEKAEKAAKEAAEKAAKEAAEKAAQDAEESKKAAEESSEVISIPASAGSETKTTPSTSDAEIVIELYTVDGVTYEFAAGVLYDAFSEVEGTLVTDLVVPETLGGATVEKLHTEFWSASEAWHTVTIPATVTKFGDVSALSKRVTVICSEGSIAASFFKTMGYSVQTVQ